MANIAIIGSGISGMVCAHILKEQHTVTVYEKNDYLGGHTHTHNIELQGAKLTVDTGFIVYNDRSYPNFIKLLAQLGCEGTKTEMSFSVKNPTLNLEYNGHNLNTLFAQRRNLVRPSFLRMVKDILRFNRIALDIPKSSTLTLDDYLKEMKFSKPFKDQYLLPMAAAIWSTGTNLIGQFPVRSIVDFYSHHGLLDLRNRPQWYVVKGGSNQYIKKIASQLTDIRLNQSVTSVQREAEGVTLTTSSGPEHFDKVIIAAHSDDALTLLADPTTDEKSILGDIRYVPNVATLHTDIRQLPIRPKARASWNYLVDDARPDQATLTYNMNRLQHISQATPVMVTLNQNGQISPELIIDEFEYRHPYYDARTLSAQSRYARLEKSGSRQNTYFCGAYWSFGFHEDGVNSALRVCKSLGAEL